MENILYRWSTESKKRIRNIVKPDKKVFTKLMEEMTSEEYDKYHDDKSMFKGTKQQAVSEARQAANDLYYDRSVNIKSIDDAAIIAYGLDNDRADKSKKAFFIYILYASNKARGKGYGGKLVRHCIEEWEDKYKSKHIPLQLTVFKVNKNAIGMYKHLGFEIDKKVKLDTHYVMEYTKE